MTKAKSTLANVAACEAMFDEFTPFTGRQVMDQTRYFQANPNHEKCSGADAFTFLGSRSVYICSSFQNLGHRDAAVRLIHEALHEVGHPEKPPSPNALTSPRSTPSEIGMRPIGKPMPSRRAFPLGPVLLSCLLAMPWLEAEARGQPDQRSPLDAVEEALGRAAQAVAEERDSAERYELWQRALEAGLAAGDLLRTAAETEEERLRQGEILFGLGRAALYGNRTEAEVEAHLQGALRFFLEDLGPRSARVGDVYCELANIRSGGGDLEEGLRLQRLCLERRREERGEIHPSVGEAETILGAIFEMREEWNEALKAHRRAVEILEPYGETELERVTLALSGLQNVLERLGRMKEAKEVEARWIDM